MGRARAMKDDGRTERQHVAAHVVAVEQVVAPWALREEANK